MLTNKSIAWFVSNLVDNSYQELYSAELASTRMRAGVCARAFEAHGYQLLPICCEGTQLIPEFTFVGKFVLDSYTNRYLHDAGTRWQIWLDRLRFLVASGSKIILDYTDHHLANTNRVGDFYRCLFREGLVHQVVVPSKKMKDNFLSSVVLPCSVIPEPIEIEIQLVKQDLQSTRTALWFGHNSNLKFLYEFLLTRYAYPDPLTIVIMTNHIDPDQLKSVLQKTQGKVTCRVFKWSLAAMQKIASQVDFVMIPGNKLDPLKNGVSPGRLHTALGLGLPVTATMLDSYAEYSEYFQDIDAADLNHFIQNPAIFWPKVASAQEMLRENYTITAIENLWVSSLT